ncbi:MAG: PEP-CTERM sorting domain-containing protein [Bryobacteraceae bacterium]
MRILTTFSLSALLTASAWALPSLPRHFTDPLASEDPTDVIGNPLKFDIHSLTFQSLTGNALQIDIRFNYGGGSTLAGFLNSTGAVTLNVGDLFLTGGGQTYAFILNGHDGLQTNGLYSITNRQTAQTVLGNPGGINYRPNSLVWASANGASFLSNGSSNIQVVGGPTELLARLTLNLTPGALANLDNGFDFFFAAATCGNDEIFGTVSNVPEPGTWTLMGAGLIGLGMLGRRR